MKTKLTTYIAIITIIASILLLYSCPVTWEYIKNARSQYNDKDYQPDGTLELQTVQQRFSQWMNSDVYRNIQPKTEELISVSSVVDLIAIGTDIETLSGHYYLANDIDISGVENWKPLGQGTKPFAGKFYGNGHIIYGLKINRDKTANEQGLFGRTFGATIQDLGVGVVSFKAGSAIGAIAGSADVDSTITNVAVAPLTDTAAIQGSGGYYWRAISRLALSMDNGIFSKGANHALVGGLVGHVHKRSHLQGYNLGLPVTFTDFTHSLYVNFMGFIGGLAGSNYGTVEGISTADVKSINTTAGFIGGLVGKNRGKVVGVSTGDVSTDYAPYIGGLVGFNGYEGDVIGVATGDVSSQTATIVVIGGLIGSNQGSVRGTSTGNVFAEFGGKDIGGFIGEVYANSSAVGYTLSNVFFQGGSHTSWDYIGPAIGNIWGEWDDSAVYHFYTYNAFDRMMNRGHVGGSVNSHGVAVQHQGGAITIGAKEMATKLKGLFGFNIGDWTFTQAKWPKIILPDYITSVLDVTLEEPDENASFPE